ncbi:MAG TPA: carboxymuconolactone decarboxylase family protein, partial [Solirubrobacteraceae bacterium]
RLGVLRPEDLEPSASALLAKLPRGPNGPLNLMAVLIHNPDATRAWGRFTGTLLLDGHLAPRERELLILRTAWNVRSSYEWGNHVQIGLNAGLTAAQIGHLADAEPDGEWSIDDRLLIRIADEVHSLSGMRADTLGDFLVNHSPADAIEAIFVVGVYHVVGSLVHSLGVVDEPATPRLGAVEVNAS